MPKMSPIQKISAYVGVIATVVTIVVGLVTIFANPDPAPRGMCGEGIANPQGWWNGIPKCGEEGNWLVDCDRRVKPFKIIIVPETEKRIRECSCLESIIN